MGEGKTNMFGKTYNTIGSTDSNFIIKTKGDLKVQWGGKFIDVIKNGKLASAGADILKVASSSDDISSNGIYLVPADEGNEVWVSIDGTKVNIAGEVGTMYVSFLANQKDVTTDQKYTALVNAGFYYETIEDAQKAGISAGIIYVVGENKLYVAKNGQLQEYSISRNSTEAISNNYFDEITIKNLRIYNDGSVMTISSPNLTFQINDKKALSIENEIRSYFNIDMQVGTYIQSDNANSKSGYRLYIKDGKSILEVDQIIWRDMTQILDNTNITKLDDYIIHSTNSNIIQSALIQDKTVICTLRYPNTFKKGGKVYILTPLAISASVEYELNNSDAIIKASVGTVTVSENITIEVFYVSNNVSNSTTITIPAGKSEATSTIQNVTGFMITRHNVLSKSANQGVYSKGQLIECDIVSIDKQKIGLSMDESLQQLFVSNCYGAYIHSSNTVLTKLSQNNIDLLDRSQDSEIVHTRIGSIKEEEIESLKECPKKEENAKLEESPSVGIYSDNFIGLNSKLYDSVFKKRCDYPKYDESVEIPEDFQDEKYNKVVPNIDWVQELMRILIPRGTIVMYHSTDIPKGWALCDGSTVEVTIKGVTESVTTPDLRGKFIKASDGIIIGENQTDDNIDEGNNLTLIDAHLPYHKHPHNHTITGTISGKTKQSGNLSMSGSVTSYTSNSYTDSVQGGDGDSTSITSYSISSNGFDSVTVSGANHTHDISVDIKDQLTVSQEVEEENASQKVATAIKIEPHAYSLVFIMKL